MAEAAAHKSALHAETSTDWVDLRKLAMTTFFHGEVYYELETTKNKGQLLTNIAALRKKIAHEGLDFNTFDEPLVLQTVKLTKLGGSGGAAASSGGAASSSTKKV